MSFPRKKATLREADADLRRSSSTSQPSLGNRKRPDNEDSVALEVLIPPVLPRVRQSDERAAFRIKSTQGRSLARIAVVAGESEVFAVASSAMLGFERSLRFGKYGEPIRRRGRQHSSRI